MSGKTIPEAVAELRMNISVLKCASPMLPTANVIMQLTRFANMVETAYMHPDNQHPNLDVGGASVAMDFGRACVATVHHYEVRETMAGRCNLVATFTDPHRAAEYAERIAREG